MAPDQKDKKRGKRRLEIHPKLRLFMILIHILVIMTGLVLVLVGLLSSVISKILTHRSFDSTLLLANGTCQVGLGLVLLLVSIFGCVVSYFYSYSYLERYSYIVILFGISYLIYAIFQILSLQTLLDWSDKKNVRLRIEESESTGWRYMQSTFKCCGYNTYYEWFNTSARLWIPIECCKPDNNLSQVARVVDEHRCLNEVNKLPVESKYFHTKGCKNIIRKTIEIISTFMNIFSLVFLALICATVVTSRKLAGLM